MIHKKPSKHQGRVSVTFVLPAERVQGSVSVVGDFNNWDPSAHPLKRKSNKTSSATVLLEAGQRHVFRYVCGDGSWTNEDDADAFEPNGFGDVNCVLMT